MNYETYREYIYRINLVIDHINRNLDKDLSLKELSDIAMFSEYHFHRVFKAFVGETLNEFVRRLRLENAATSLLYNHKLSITEIAYKFGFSSSANFSKAFKKHFKTTPSELRGDSKIGKHYSNIGKVKSKNGKDIFPLNGYSIDVDMIKPFEEEKMDVKVVDFEKTKVAYVRNLNGYVDTEIAKVWKSLYRWAGARGVINKDTLMIGLGLDDPAVTPADKCRYDACISIDQSIEGEGEVGIQYIDGGKYAVYHFEGKPEEIKKGYHYMYAHWLPENGYIPADKPPFERYFDTSCETVKDRVIVMDIYIPVKPM